MRTSWLSVGLLSFALAPALGGGCQCINDDNFNQLKDAGFEPTDAGPPPPVFPLKAGDILTYPVLGGRVNECGGGGQSGECDRVLKATYNLSKVEIDDDNRWDVTADVLYEGQADTIPASALSRLALENVADFGAVTVANSVPAPDALFTTDRAPQLSSDFNPNNFPFFQAANAIDDGDNGEVFAAGAEEFTTAIEAIDEDAAISTQVAAGKMEAFFKDPVGGEVSLHKLLVQFHPMGFICGWDESLIPFVEGETARSQASFQGVNNPPLTASFLQPTLVRGGVTFQCSCFSRTCRANDQTCLDPTDPDAAPSAAACDP